MMTQVAKDGLDALGSLIARGEERRVNAMIHIAFLEAEDQNPHEARADLMAIEKFLKTMRTQRALLIASIHHNDMAKGEANTLQSAA
ncbi:hypothetical protein [Methylobacterium sp. E-045]|uniref:hypothetical protein n=1 Tax=Methylobacterium sp. E-045 TaxID=2836575 RepID=UPI001FBA23A7|nr:hypothetical protein [Methylobacterium sp. E-045]MCJ2131321.1 hypothetical protein [Methylobacterium sp. E-045]